MTFVDSKIFDTKDDVARWWVASTGKRRTTGLKFWDIYFENNGTTTASWRAAIVTEKTGMYHLWFVICDPELFCATVNCQTDWKNPMGASL